MMSESIIAAFLISTSITIIGHSTAMSVALLVDLVLLREIHYVSTFVID